MRHLAQQRFERPRLHRQRLGVGLQRLKQGRVFVALGETQPDEPAQREQAHAEQGRRFSLLLRPGGCRRGDGERGGSPVALAPLAPAVGRLVAVPLASVLAVVQLHLHAVPGAPAVRPCLRIGGLDYQGEALQHHVQPGQQAPLVTVAQGQLPLTAGPFEVHVPARGCLRQRRGVCYG